MTPSSELVAPTTVLGDWYANLLYTRPQQLVLAMSERSLLCVLVPASPGDVLGRRVREAVAGLLPKIGVPQERVVAEVSAMEALSIGATASRAVLGCMTDAALQLNAYPRGRTDALPLREAGAVPGREHLLAHEVPDATTQGARAVRCHDRSTAHRAGSVAALSAGWAR